MIPSFPRPLLWSLSLPVALASVACKPLAEAEESFDDALVTVYRTFDAEDADLAPALRNLETQMYVNLRLETNSLADHAVEPSRLTWDDVAGLEGVPDRDPAQTLAVATGHLSPFDIDDHAVIPLQADQRPMEPQSPDHFDRQFLEGADCWLDRSCLWLRTFQDLTKSYSLLGNVTYQFFKDFRWVDLHADGAGDGPRWAFIARSWNPGSYARSGEKPTDNDGLVLWQSYTLELWFPRDGRGFAYSDEFPRPEDRPEAVDSSGGGTLRLLTLWTETKLPVATDQRTEVGTIRWGTKQNFDAHDAWLEER